ncbi:MAG: fumarylacetoacetate hydrolase family protein [Alloprevotella sp.]
MKLIVVCNNFATHNNEALSPLEDIGFPVVHTLADTALLLHGRPFFVPDYAEPCTATCHLALRISRLGKCISERFAHRYYDALTVAALFRAEGLLRRLSAAGLPWDVACGFDNAAAIGRFVPVGEADPALTRLSLRLDNAEAAAATTEHARFSPDRLVAHVSRYYTLRQGDLIFCGNPAPPVSVAIGQHLTASLNDQELLSFNIR